MTSRRIARRLLTLCLAVVVVSLVLGHLLGQPILLGYVATESMEPTMDAGDGFVAIPSAVAGSPDVGDVVVFEAQELHGGGLTTHRVVDVTGEGYVTHGDANPFTDQDGAEPPVTDGQIVAEALQVNGHVVTIPHLGTVVTGVQTVVGAATDGVVSSAGVATAFEGEDAGALLVAIGVALLGFGVLVDATGTTHRDASRSTARENVVAFWAAVGVILLVLVTAATAAMVLPSGGVAYGLVATDSPTDDPQAVAPGERTDLTRTVENAGYLPVTVVAEPRSPGVAVDPDRMRVGMRSNEQFTVSMTAPDEPGSVVRRVDEYRYLAVLPSFVLAAAHGIHPLVAIAAVDAVVVGVVVAVVIAGFGLGDFRLRRPGHHVPLRTRIERKLRKWR